MPYWNAGMPRESNVPSSNIAASFAHEYYCCKNKAQRNIGQYRDEKESGATWSAKKNLSDTGGESFSAQIAAQARQLFVCLSRYSTQSWRYPSARNDPEIRCDTHFDLFSLEALNLFAFVSMPSNKVDSQFYRFYELNIAYWADGTRSFKRLPSCLTKHNGASYVFSCYHCLSHSVMHTQTID